MVLAMDLPIIIGIVAAAVVLVLGICTGIICILKKKRGSGIRVDEEFIQELFTAYGGKENIKEVGVDNARLKVTVEDLDAVNLRTLKELSQGGVFVTGNTIKTLYKFDSKAIEAQLIKK